jgi:hypothetical protein
LPQLLQRLYPVGGDLDVLPLHRATDFFLGLNAGQWLKIRIAQISDASRAHLAAAGGGGDPETPCGGGPPQDALARALREVGLAPSPPLTAAEPAPPDSAHLFHYYGNFAVTPESLGR